MFSFKKIPIHKIQKILSEIYPNYSEIPRV